MIPSGASFLLLALLVGGGCAVPRLADRPAETSQAQEWGRRWSQQLAERNQAVQTVKAGATLQWNARGFSRATSQAVVIQRPANVRIDSYSDFGALLQQLIYAQGALTLYWPEEGVVRHGEAAEKILTRRLKLTVPLRELALLLSGGIPLEATPFSLGAQREEAWLLRGDHSQILIDPDSFVPLEFRSKIEGSRSFYTVTFNDYQKVDGFLFPQRIILELLRPKLRLEIEYHDVQINRSVPPTVFEMLR